MKTFLQSFVISLLLVFLASCSNVGVDGTANGGSGSSVHAGVGVNIHMYKNDISPQ